MTGLPGSSVLVEMEILRKVICLILMISATATVFSKRSPTFLASSRAEVSAFAFKCLDGGLVCSFPTKIDGEIDSSPNASTGAVSDSALLPEDASRVLSNAARHHKVLFQLSDSTWAVIVGIKSDCVFVAKLLQALVQEQTTLYGKNNVFLRMIADKFAQYLSRMAEESSPQRMLATRAILCGFDDSDKFEMFQIECWGEYNSVDSCNFIPKRILDMDASSGAATAATAAQQVGNQAEEIKDMRRDEVKDEERSTKTDFISQLCKQLKGCMRDMLVMTVAEAETHIARLFKQLLEEQVFAPISPESFRIYKLQRK